MKNHDRFYWQLAIKIAYCRKKKGLTQLHLAEKAEISRTHLSNTEAPGHSTPFSTTVMFNIAEALETEPVDLFIVP